MLRRGWRGDVALADARPTDASAAPSEANSETVEVSRAYSRGLYIQPSHAVIQRARVQCVPHTASGCKMTACRRATYTDRGRWRVDAHVECVIATDGTLTRPLDVRTTSAHVVPQFRLSWCGCSGVTAIADAASRHIASTAASDAARAVVRTQRPCFA